MRLKDCFEKRLLLRMSKSRELIEKTFEMAVSDLSEAEIYSITY